MAHSAHWTAKFASNMVGIIWMENTDYTDDTIVRVSPQVGKRGPHFHDIFV